MTNSAAHAILLGLSASSSRSTSGSGRRRDDASGDSISNGNSSDSLRETLRFDTIDAITTLYASKLMEGYTLADNGELCFRCHMPLLHRGQQQHQSSNASLDNESASIRSGPKRICVVCHEEWESADSFEEKLVVFSAMQAAQLEEDEDDGTTTTSNTNAADSDDNDDDEDDEDDDDVYEDENRNDESRSGKCCRQSSDLCDGDTNHVGHSNSISNGNSNSSSSNNNNNNIQIHDKYTSPQLDDLNILSCQEADDDDATMNVEITLRTRCKSCAMDLPIYDYLYDNSKNDSFLRYPRGTVECSFCHVAHVAKLVDSSTDEMTIHAIDAVGTMSTVDNFDLLLIQENLDMMNVKDEEQLDVEDKSMERGVNEDESDTTEILEGEEVNDYYRMTEPIMEPDGAEVRLMTDGSFRDHNVSAAKEDNECSQTEVVLDTTLTQEEREITVSKSVEVVQPDESRNDDMIIVEKERADVLPQPINDPLPVISDHISKPPLDKTRVFRGLIAKFLQQNLFGHSEPSLDGDQCSKSDASFSSDDDCEHQNMVNNDACVSERNLKSNVTTRTTSSIARDPPTTELDPPATDSTPLHEVHNNIEDIVEKGRHVRNVDHERNYCSAPRGMDPPETDAAAVDSRDVNPCHPNIKLLDVRDNIEEKSIPDKIKSASPRQNKDTLSASKLSTRHEYIPPTNSTKRVDCTYSTSCKVNGATTSPVFKFHALKKYALPAEEDGGPYLSEDDVRGRLAQIEFQFSRKDAIGKDILKKNLPASSVPMRVEKVEHQTQSSSGSSSGSGRVVVSCSGSGSGSSSGGSSTAPEKNKQRLPLSPTAAARHRRIKEDLIARKKALSALSQSTPVSLE